MRFLFIFVSCLSILIFLESSFVQAKNEPSGLVSGIRGLAYSFNATGETRQLKKGDRIAPGDYVHTDKRSRIKITFLDRTVVTLGESSTIVLKDYGWSEKKHKGKFKVKITEGFFRIIGGKITKKSPKKFITETPVATIGIRGSSYAGELSKAGLRVFLKSGKGIDVYNKKGSVALLRPGRGTVVTSANAAPTSPRFFNAAEVYDILKESSYNPGDATGGGSVIDSGGVLINRSTVTNSVNIATGRNNRADMGSIYLRDSKVSGMISNDSDVSNSANIAGGDGNSASMGSVEGE